MLTAHCPACHHAYPVPESLAGQATLCPLCGEKFRVRGVGEPRKLPGTRRARPAAVFAAGIFAGLGAGLLAWAFWPASPSPATEAVARAPVPPTTPATSSPPPPAAPARPGPGPDAEAREQQRRAAIEAEKKRLAEAEGRERQRKWKLEWDALNPGEQNRARAIAGKLENMSPDVRLSEKDLDFMAAHVVLYDYERFRKGLVKYADNLGFQRFRRLLGWPDGDYLEDRALMYAILPAYRGVPGWFVASQVAEAINTRGRDNIGQGHKVYLRDHDELFKPPPEKR